MIKFLLSLANTVFYRSIFPPGNITVVLWLTDHSDFWEELLPWESPLVSALPHSSPLSCQNVLPDIHWVLFCFILF